jgi:hypothetical protein
MVWPWRPLPILNTLPAMSCALAWWRLLIRAGRPAWWRAGCGCRAFAVGGVAGRGLRVWAPPSVGEQCLVLSPEGDLGNGIVLPGLYCDAFPAPSDQPDLVCFAFADGAWIGYDPVRHALAVTLRGHRRARCARWADHPWRCYRQRQPDRQRRCRGEGFPQGPPAFRRAGRQRPDRGAGMSSLYKISWTKRVCYCRLFVWAPVPSATADMVA